MANNGLGPAIIRAFKVYIAGEERTDFDPTGWFAAVTEVGFPKCRVAGTKFQEGDAFAAGETRQVLHIAAESSVKDVQQIAQWLSKISVKIEYQSIYEEDFEVQVNKPPC